MGSLLNLIQTDWFIIVNNKIIDNYDYFYLSSLSFMHPPSIIPILMYSGCTLDFKWAIKKIHYLI